jgi:hypothetical protein
VTHEKLVKTKKNFFCCFGIKEEENVKKKSAVGGVFFSRSQSDSENKANKLLFK